MSLELQHSSPEPIVFDPRKFSRVSLQRMAQTVLDDPSKGLVLKYSDGRNAIFHAKLPQLDRPNLDKKQVALSLVPHLLAAEEILPVDVNPRLIDAIF